MGNTVLRAEDGIPIFTEQFVGWERDFTGGSKNLI
jgi:hypothetical protein